MGTHLLRELDDLLRNQQRNDEDLINKIRQEERIIQLNNPDVPFGPPDLSSTPMTKCNVRMPSTQITAFAPSAALPPASFSSSSRWPKIIVQPFNGDPRKWKKVDHDVGATIKGQSTTMPDSLKLLSLQEVLTDEIRKRMTHIFNNGYSFEQAYKELSEKYGSPGVVMQAHNNHLLQAQPVRVGDFNAVFILAADVSVSDEHIVAFTYSTVIFSLASKLHPQLQIDWGKFAYAL